MKKVLKMVAAIAIILSVAGGAASAQTTGCHISGTGPGSTNVCNSNENSTITITCNNTEEVIYVNGQSANTGTATVTNNTNGGGAQTGQAGNVNFTYTGENVTCGPAQQPTQVAVGGQGAVAAPTGTTPTPTVKALPKTGNNDLAAITGMSLVAAAVLALAARFGVAAYRGSSLK